MMITLNNKNFTSLFLISLFGAGCGPGASDYNKSLGQTGLEYSDSNLYSRNIDAYNADGSLEPVIESTIIEYKVKRDLVFGVRQVVNHYLCEGQYMDVEVTDRFEFFSIEVSENRPRHTTRVFSEFSEFESYLKNKHINSKVINSLAPRFLKEYFLAVLPLRESCINPRL